MNNLCNIKNRFLKVLLWHLPFIPLIAVFIYSTININEAKILSAYYIPSKSAVIYNASNKGLHDIEVTITLEDYAKRNVQAKFKVPYLHGYEERCLSFSDKLPNAIQAKVTNVNVKAFKVNYFNLCLLSLSVFFSLLYYNKTKKYLNN